MPIAMILNKLPQEQVDVRHTIDLGTALTLLPTLLSSPQRYLPLFLLLLFSLILTAINTKKTFLLLQIQVAKMKWENRKVMLQMQLLPHYTAKRPQKL
jgi:hypothetical protein